MAYDERYPDLCTERAIYAVQVYMHLCTHVTAVIHNQHKFIRTNQLYASVSKKVQLHDIRRIVK